MVLSVTVISMMVVTYARELPLSGFIFLFVPTKAIKTSISIGQ